MSNDKEKQKHGERVSQKLKKLKRKMKLAKTYGYTHVLKNPHKYHKSSVFRCGNKNCIMCMNPRKSFGEETMQERRAKQVAGDE
jgi:hypothetical protein